MSDDFLNSALREEARLVRHLAAVRAVIADYRSESAQHVGNQSKAANNAPAKPRVARQESMASQVIRISEEFLGRIERRARSTEIYSEMKQLGVEIDATNPAAVVSSYLSSSVKFDNVRGQGYGLTAWSARHQTDEAP